MVAVLSEEFEFSMKFLKLMKRHRTLVTLVMS